MQFDTPSNPGEMVNILMQIYNYYRIRHDEIYENELEELDLERLEFTPLSDQELRQKAVILTNALKQREKEEKKSEIEEKIAALSESIKSVEENAVILKNKIIAAYEIAKSEILEDLKKNGLSKSSVAIEKLSELKNNENAETKDVEKDKLEKITAALSEIKGLTVKKSKIDETIDAVYEKEIEKKVNELKDAQEKTEREVFRYNNSLSEKEQRYHNDILYRGTLFNIRKAEILQKEYTKEELVIMGYYKDVITCVRAYFDTLTPRQAYESFKINTDVLPFLDDFYGELLYYYERNYLSTQS